MIWQGSDTYTYGRDGERSLLSSTQGSPPARHVHAGQQAWNINFGYR